MSNQTTKIKYSFAPGVKKIPLGEQKRLKRELYEILSIKDRSVFSRKKKCIINIAKPLYDRITMLFAGYGVSESDVWEVSECS